MTTLSPRCEQILDSPTFVRERARLNALTPEQRQAELAEAIAADEQRRAANAPIIAAHQQARERVRADDAEFLAFARKRIADCDRAPEQIAADDAASRAELLVADPWLGDAEEARLVAVEMARVNTERVVNLAAWRAHRVWHAAECERVAAMSDAELALKLSGDSKEATAMSNAAPAARLIQSSAEFVAGFVAPSYLLDGILQRRFCYSLTAQTGVGKTAVALRLAAHVALGRKLGDRDVEQGRVLYFASENHVDVQARWIGMAEHCGFDANTIDVHFVSGATKLSEIAERISTEAQALGDLAFVIVDTSAATFEGDDENSNVHAIMHAKRMRSLTLLRGGPTVLVLCHPTKSATADNLQPRGGSSFIAEIDGNLCARKSESAVEVHWSGKFRGMDFAPMLFRLDTVVATRLKDGRGRNMPTVIATPMDEAGKAAMTAAGRRDEDVLLQAIQKHHGASYNELAKSVGWKMGGDKPYGVKARRAAEKLAGDGMIAKHRGVWVLTSKGEKELNNLGRSGTSTVPTMPDLPQRN